MRTRSWLDQRCPHRVAAPGHHVDHARWIDPGQDPGELERGERRLLRRLEHHRVARRQRRGEFPGRHHQGIVPGRHLRDHAHRIAPDHAGQSRQVLARGHPRHAARGTGEEAEAIDDRRQFVPECPGRRLAGVARLQLREGLAVLLDLVGHLQELERPLLRRGSRPGGKGGVSGRDGLLHLRQRRLGDRGDPLARCRVEDRFGRALAVDEPAVDQKLGLHDCPPGLTGCWHRRCRPARRGRLDRAIARGAQKGDAAPWLTAPRPDRP